MVQTRQNYIQTIYTHRPNRLKYLKNVLHSDFISLDSKKKIRISNIVYRVFQLGKAHTV